jgi:hypothetical protein
MTVKVTLTQKMYDASLSILFLFVGAPKPLS